VLSFSDASLILSEDSGIDVSTTSEYVIKISCTDGDVLGCFSTFLAYNVATFTTSVYPQLSCDITSNPFAREYRFGVASSLLPSILDNCSVFSFSLF
jgi:hypothetical protein